MSRSQRLLGCWLGLALLTLASVQLAGAGTSTLLATLVLLAALAKGWLISERFMELRHAPRLWRGLLLGWPLAMGLGVWLALLLSAS